jgi:hypothetical protein
MATLFSFSRVSLIEYPSHCFLIVTLSSGITHAIEDVSIRLSRPASSGTHFSCPDRSESNPDGPRTSKAVAWSFSFLPHLHEYVFYKSGSRSSHGLSPYTVTQGLAGAGAALLQLVDLVLYFVKKWFFGRTPRQAFDVTFLMPNVCRLDHSTTC